jgi:hypothetical protein
LHVLVDILIIITFTHVCLFTGALFGGMSAVQTACNFFGSLLFSAIYKDTVYFYKGTIFLLMAGMVFISLILCL